MANFVFVEIIAGIPKMIAKYHTVAPPRDVSMKEAQMIRAKNTYKE